MPKVFIKVLFSVVTKMAMAACGEKVISWLLFKLLDEMAQSTKTTADDEFVAMVKKAYAQKQK